MDKTNWGDHEEKDVVSSIENSIKLSDKLVIEAEMEHKFSIVNMTNSFKERKQKLTEINVLNKEEEILKEE